MTFKEYMGENLLSEGSYLGYTIIICHNNMGFRCGYLKILQNHPWYGQEYDNIEAECHGGLTFSRMFGDEWWIGFDCAHLGDAPDPFLPVEYTLPSFVGVVRDRNYVKRELRKLCQQAKDAYEDNKRKVKKL